MNVTCNFTILYNKQRALIMFFFCFVTRILKVEHKLRNGSLVFSWKCFYND